jgi:hypothetical protein
LQANPQEQPEEIAKVLFKHQLISNNGRLPFSFSEKSFTSRIEALIADLGEK